MRDQAENNSQITEPQTQSTQREQESPRYDSETDEPQICRGID